MSGNWTAIVWRSAVGVVSFTKDLGILPTRNSQTGVFEGADKISGETF